ncbi:MAG: hypothetical protein BME94_08520 [Methanobacteriales archaeon Met13]
MVIIIKLDNIEPQNLFVVIALIFGILFLFTTPPFQGHDEASHLYRASDISNGHLMPQKDAENSWVYVPNSLRMISHLFQQGFTNLNIAYITSKLDFPIDYKYESKINLASGAMVTYSPLPYLSQALGVKLGILLNLPPLLVIYLTRFMNLVFCILLLFMAIRITPVHKWVFFMLALMPMTLFQMAMITADGVTISMSFLVIAAFLYYSLNPTIESIKRSQISTLFLLIAILALCKHLYFLLALLFLIIPSGKLGGKEKKYAIFAVIMAFALSIVLTLYSYTQILYVPENISSSLSGQVAFLLKIGPLWALKLFCRTINSQFDFYISSFVGMVGWRLIIPLWLAWLYIVGLIVAALFDARAPQKISLHPKKKLILGIVAIMIILEVFVVEYLAWTPVGQNYIGGVQGRYLIPVAPLIFLLLWNKKLKNYLEEKYLKIIVIIIVIFTLSLATWAIINRYLI